MGWDRGDDGFAKHANLIASDCVFLMGKKHSAENGFVVALDKPENLKCCFLL